MAIKITFENGILSKNGVLASSEELKEFEEEVLGKKISEASEVEILAAVRNLEAGLVQWAWHKDAWKAWKKWAEEQ